MKICGRGVNWMQVINEKGDCCLCSWASNNIVGNMLEDDIKKIMRSREAKEFQETLLNESYEFCKKENCLYLANGKMNEILTEIEAIPNYPNELHLAYEGICNYNCTCCTSHDHMKDAKQNDYTENIKKIEERLQEILPHVKTLGANGRGELFASKSILKLLSEWKPLAPKEEIKVILETNGSLFDEKHWKQIENLGQYNLKVAITVMSFNEPIYQHLSGTKLPISRIEDNLKFVKKLKEKGIINFLELATVLQEENFREMPEFTRRCIEEYGADRVRIRPVFPGGIYDNNIQWFMDVRNPEHPYYSQYIEMLKHPIFKHPNVLLWSGDLASSRGKHPGIKAVDIQNTMDYMLSETNLAKKVANILKERNVSIYGLGVIGKILVQLNDGSLKICEIYDKVSSLDSYKNILVKRMYDSGNNKAEIAAIIVTVYQEFDMVKKQLRAKGFSGKIINLFDLLKEMGM